LASLGESGGDYESPLEAQVAEEIKTLGYEVRAQVGCSGFRIDLGVIDPTQPGMFILGVECDGATYHSAYTARDRDRIRQEALEKLGWRIHRIWAPDFATRHDLEVQRLKKVIENARDAPPLILRTEDHRTESAETPPAEPPSPNTTPRVPNPVSNNNRDWLTYYKAHIPSFNPRWNLQFHDATRIVSNQLIEIVDNEGPIHIDNAAHRLAQTWGLQRVGHRMSATVDTAVRIAMRSNRLRRTGEFLYPVNTPPLLVRKPNPNDGDTYRTLDHVPPEEIELAFTKTLQEALSISRETLVTQTARLFGVDRVSIDAQQYLNRILERLISNGKIIDKEGRLTPNAMPVVS